MIPGLIPNRYAKALYKYASEHNSTKQVYDEMKNVISSFSRNNELEKVISNPYIGKKDKKDLLLKAAGDNPGNDYVRFVDLILEHKRESFAYLMALAYREIYRNQNNISQVKIQTAVKLSDSEIDKLKDLVNKSFPKRTLEYNIVVNSEIIGGFIIDVDSTRMDASISGELQQLRQNLLGLN